MCSQACPKCPNNKCATSLQHLKKKVKDEVDFLPGDTIKGFFKLIPLF